MKYESEFRIKEKEFYPREKYSHEKVIDELANIVKRADLDIEELCRALDNECEVNERQYIELKETERDLHVALIAVCFFISTSIIGLFL